MRHGIKWNHITLSRKRSNIKAIIIMINKLDTIIHHCSLRKKVVWNKKEGSSTYTNTLLQSVRVYVCDPHTHSLSSTSLGKKAIVSAPEIIIKTFTKQYIQFNISKAIRWQTENQFIYTVHRSDPDGHRRIYILPKFDSVNCTLNSWNNEISKNNNHFYNPLCKHHLLQYIYKYTN